MRLGTLDDARRAWAVIYREPPPDARLETGRLAGWHAWWQCQPGRARDPVPVPWSLGKPDADRADLADIRADLMEMRLLGRDGLEQLYRELGAVLGAPGLAEQKALAQARSVDPYRGLRLNLRWAALDRMLAPKESEAPGAPGRRVGVRRGRVVRPAPSVGRRLGLLDGRGLLRAVR